MKYLVLHLGSDESIKFPEQAFESSTLIISLIFCRGKATSVRCLHIKT